LLSLTFLGLDWWSRTDASSLVAGTFVDGRWLMFAVGIAVYYGLVYGSGQKRMALLVSLLTGVLFCAARLHDLKQNVANDLNLSCLVAFSFAGSLVLLRKHDRFIDEARILRPVRWCGTRCYSLYLVHWPTVKPVSKLLSRA